MSFVWKSLAHTVRRSLIHSVWQKHQISVPAGSSIKPQIPSEFNVHAVFERKSLQVDPEFLHTCLMCLCRAFYKSFLRSFFVCFWPDIWVFVFPKFPAKRKEKQSQKARQGHVKHVYKISGSIFKKRRRPLEFCAVKCKNHGLAS